MTDQFPQEHGTIKGFHQHRDNRTSICDACRVAQKSYMDEQAKLALGNLPGMKEEAEQRRKIGRPISPIIHGSYSGYQKHLSRNIKMCAPCREAMRQYRQAQRENGPDFVARPPGRPPEPIKHGTYAGYRQEVRRGIDPCELCKEAQKAYRKSLRDQTPPGTARETDPYVERVRVSDMRELLRLTDMDELRDFLNDLIPPNHRRQLIPVDRLKS
jgi:hypothetical protein